MQSSSHAHPNVGQTERSLSSAAGTALLFAAAREKSLLLALLGGAALHRGLTGNCALYSALGINTACHKENHKEEIKVEQSVVIQRPRNEVYAFWRNLENIPHVWPHVQKVEVQGDGLSHWVAKGPFGKSLDWNARIINEIDNELLAWRSTADSEFSNAGSVRFENCKDDSTNLRVSLAFTPPGGKAGEMIADIFGVNPAQQLREDLMNLKNFLDARKDRELDAVTR